MPTPLEIYYRNKAKNKATVEQKQKAVADVAGVPYELLKKKSPGFFHQLLDVLDRPGNATRALMVGKLGGLKGLIPFAQFFEDMTGVNIAIDPKERVPGTEVVEKLFGRQRQRKGKIDPVDALGFLVEVVADPLWLLGGLGTLTKVGRATRLAESSLKGIGRLKTAARYAKGTEKAKYLKAAAEEITFIRKIVKFAKTGKGALPAGSSKKLVKAFQTVYKAGYKPKIAKTWAEQVSKGQMALFTIGLPGRRVSLIKGKPVIEAAEKAATRFRMSRLGGAFLAHTRRVAPEYRELHEIAVHFARDLPEKKQAAFLVKIQKMYEEGAKLGKSADEIAGKLTDYIEKAGAPKAAHRLVKKAMAKRVERAEKMAGGLEKVLKKLRKKKVKIPSGEYETAIPREVVAPPKYKGGLLVTGKFSEKTRRGEIQKITREINKHPVMKIVIEAAEEQRQLIPMDRYVIAVSRKKIPGEIRDYIGKPGHKGYKGYLWNYLTTRDEPGGTSLRSWDEVVDQFGLPQDIGVFIEKLDEAITVGSTKIGGYNAKRVAKALKSGDTDFEMLVKKRELLVEGMSKRQINKGLREHVKDLGLSEETLKGWPEVTKKTALSDFLAPEPIKAPSRVAVSTIRKYEKKLAELQTRVNKAKASGKVGKTQVLQKKLQKEIESVENKIKWYRETFAKHEGKYIQKLKGTAVKRAGEAEEVLETVAPERRVAFKGLAGRYKGMQEEFLKTEKLAGVPVGETGRPLGYLRRVITPEARDFLKEYKLANVYDAVTGRKLSVSGGFQRRRGQIGAMTREEVEKFFRDKGFKGEHFFEPGIAEATFTRARESTRTIGAAETIQEAFRKLSKPLSEDFPLKAGFVDAGEIAARTKVVGLAQRYAGRQLPRDVAEALIETHRLATDPDSLEGLWRVATQAQRYMKGAFTMPWPAYHTRNAISNVFLNWINGVKNPASYRLAAQLQSAAHKTRKLVMKGVDFDDAVRQVPWPDVTTGTGRVMKGYEFYDMADSWGILGKSVGELGTTEVAGGERLVTKAGTWLGRHFRGQTAGWKLGRTVGQGIENNARLAHFIEKSVAGFDPMTAARSAKEVLFDYGDLSKFEKTWLRDRLVFFYTFARKNLPLQVKTLVQQPAKQAFFAHIAGGTPAMEKAAEMPDWWNEKLVTRPLGIGEEGKEVRVVGMGLPIEEAFGPLAGPGVGIIDRAKRIASRLASRAAPVIKAPTEFVTGRNLYFDRPIEDITAAPHYMRVLPERVRRLAGVTTVEREGRPTQYRMPAYRRWALEQTPISRLSGTASSLMAEGRSTASAITAAITGMRPRVIDPEQTREYALRNISRRLLRKAYGEGKIRRFERYYQPDKEKKDEQLKMALTMQ